MEAKATAPNFSVEILIFLAAALLKVMLENKVVLNAARKLLA